MEYSVIDSPQVVLSDTDFPEMVFSVIDSPEMVFSFILEYTWDGILSHRLSSGDILRNRLSWDVILSQRLSEMVFSLSRCGILNNKLYWFSDRLFFLQIFIHWITFTVIMYSVNTASDREFPLWILHLPVHCEYGLWLKMSTVNTAYGWECLLWILPLAENIHSEYRLWLRMCLFPAWLA